jgi:hypothetical protein
MKHCQYGSRDCYHNTSFFFETQEGPQLAIVLQFVSFITYEWVQWNGVLHYTRLERFSRDKHFSLIRPFISYKEYEVLQKRLLPINNTPFPSYLMNGSKKPEFYITLVLKDFQGTDTLAYLSPFISSKEYEALRMQLLPFNNNSFPS